MTRHSQRRARFDAMGSSLLLLLRLVSIVFWFVPSLSSVASREAGRDSQPECQTALVEPVPNSVAKPFTHCRHWTEMQHVANAVNFCEREAIFRFDCSSILVERAIEAWREQSTGDCEGCRPEGGENLHNGRVETTAKNQIVYFLHVHKAGGTSVCNIAKANGLSNSSNNCNPETQEQISRLLGNPHDQKTYFMEQLESGTSFVANEMGMPQQLLAHLPSDTVGDQCRGRDDSSDCGADSGDLEVVYATMLREPTSRLFSHFRQTIRQLQFALTLGNSSSFSEAIGPEQTLSSISKPRFRSSRKVGQVDGHDVQSIAGEMEWFVNTQRTPPNWLLQNYGLSLSQRHRDGQTVKSQTWHASAESVQRCSLALDVGRNFLAWIIGTPDNLQFRLLCGQACVGVGRGKLTLQHFQTVRRRLDADFSFVGVLEAFGLSMNVLGRELGSRGLPWQDVGWSGRQKLHAFQDLEWANKTHKQWDSIFSGSRSDAELLLPRSMRHVAKLLQDLESCMIPVEAASLSQANHQATHNVSHALKQALRTTTFWDRRVYDYARARLAHATVRGFGIDAYRHFFYNKIYFDDVLGVDTSRLLIHDPAFDASRAWDGDAWHNTAERLRWSTFADSTSKNGFDEVQRNTMQCSNSSCCGKCLPLGGWFESVVRCWHSFSLIP